MEEANLALSWLQVHTYYVWAPIQTKMKISKSDGFLESSIFAPLKYMNILV